MGTSTSYPTPRSGLAVGGGTGQFLVPGSGLLASRPTVAACGSSLVAQCQTTGAVASPGACPYYAHLQVALSFLGNPWQWPPVSASDGVIVTNLSLRSGMLGYGAGTSAQIDPYYDTYIAPLRPNFCFLEMLDNDTTGTAEAESAIIARLIARVDSMIAQGTVPIVISGAPSTGINTLGLQTRYWAIHKPIEAALALRPSVIYVPLYELYTDTSQTYGPQPGNSGLTSGWTDGIHPRRVGVEIGRFIAERIRKQVAIVPMVLPSPGSPQLVNTNNLLFGSAAMGSGTSGFAPTGFNVSSSLATATVVGSKVVRDGKECWQIDIATSGAQTGLQTAIAFNQPAIASGWSIGDYMALMVDIEFDPTVAMAGIRCLQVQLGMTGSSTSYPTTGGPMLGYASGGDTLGAYIKPGSRLKYMTPPAPIPNAGADNVTSVRPYFNLLADSGAAAVTCRMWVHSVSILNFSR